MDVVIKKTGDERTTAKVDDFGLVPECLFHIRASAYPQDAATPDREGLSDFVPLINRDGGSVYEQDVSCGDRY